MNSKDEAFLRRSAGLVERLAVAEAVELAAKTPCVVMPAAEWQGLYEGLIRGREVHQVDNALVARWTLNLQETIRSGGPRARDLAQPISAGQVEEGCKTAVEGMSYEPFFDQRPRVVPTLELARTAKLAELYLHVKPEMESAKKALVDGLEYRVESLLDVRDVAQVRLKRSQDRANRAHKWSWAAFSAPVLAPFGGVAAGATAIGEAGLLGWAVAGSMAIASASGFVVHKSIDRRYGRPLREHARAFDEFDGRVREASRERAKQKDTVRTFRTATQALGGELRTSAEELVASPRVVGTEHFWVARGLRELIGVVERIQSEQQPFIEECRAAGLDAGSVRRDLVELWKTRTGEEGISLPEGPQGELKAVEKFLLQRAAENYMFNGTNGVLPASERAVTQLIQTAPDECARVNASRLKDLGLEPKVFEQGIATSLVKSFAARAPFAFVSSATNVRRGSDVFRQLDAQFGLEVPELADPLVLISSYAADFENVQDVRPTRPTDAVLEAVNSEQRLPGTRAASGLEL